MSARTVGAQDELSHFHAKARSFVEVTGLNGSRCSQAQVFIAGQCNRGT